LTILGNNRTAYSSTKTAEIRLCIAAERDLHYKLGFLAGATELSHRDGSVAPSLAGMSDSMSNRRTLATGLLLSVCAVATLGGGSWAAAGDSLKALATGASSAAATRSPAAASSATQPPFDAADNAWMLISSALVLFMTAPALALFYGGLVRRKNILSVLMQCVFLMCVMTVVWALWGYSLVFGGDGAWLGGQRYLCMQGVDAVWDGTASVLPQFPK
jgi:hypothetical protein